MFGCCKIPETGGTLEIVSHERAGATDQECGQAELVEGLVLPWKGLSTSQGSDRLRLHPWTH